MSEQFCTQCGAKLPEEGNFCPQCGAPVEGVAASPASPPPAQAYVPPPAQPAVQAGASAQPTGMSRTVLYGLGGIALVASLLALVYFGFLRPGGVDEATTSAQNALDIPYPDVARISVDEAHDRFEEGTAIFVDVRDRDSYATMHIPDAVWMPLTDVSARHAELPKYAQIFTYCT